MPLFALEMLYDYDRLGKCKLLGVIVDREGKNCAACADVMNIWHGYGALPVSHRIPTETSATSYPAAKSGLPQS